MGEHLVFWIPLCEDFLNFDVPTGALQVWDSVADAEKFLYPAIFGESISDFGVITFGGS